MSDLHFVLEELTRWDLRWRLSQAGGKHVLDAPVDFHTTVDAIHYMKRLSSPNGSILTLRGAKLEKTGCASKMLKIRTPAILLSNSASD